MRRRRADGPGPGCSGVALPFVLLLLLALTGLAHGGLALSRGSALLARGRAERLRTELLAEGAARAAVAGLAGPERGALPAPGEARTRPGYSPAPGLESRIVHRRLGREWHLLEAEATVRTPHGRVRAAVSRLAWILDPVARVGAVGAALEHGGRLEVGEGSPVDGSAFWELPGVDPSSVCVAYRAALDSVVSRSGIRHAGRLGGGSDPAGGPSGAPDPYGRTPGIGLLSGAALARLIEEGGAAAGAAAPGNLALDGTDRTGIFVVGGDLTVGVAATLRGVVLVGGDLELAEAARVVGWVRVRGGARLRRGSGIRGSGCEVALALGRAIPRPPPVFPAGGAWPAYP